MDEVKKRKKLNSRWSRIGTRYSAVQLIEDEQYGDTVVELTWLERRRPLPGWRNGARLRR